jgi:hypothetical protein
VNKPAEHDAALDALLGAYTLDALDPAERAAVEAYLARNPRARAEVDDLRETAAVLATAPVEGTSAPGELWERIAAEVGDDPARPTDELAERRERRGGRRAAWIASVVAAAALLLAALLTAQVLSLHRDLDDAREGDLVAAFDRATEIEGARQGALVAGEREVARVVMLPDGTGYLVGDDLQPLHESQAYQLWAISGAAEDQRVISAGVLGPDPRAATFTIDGPVSAFALTVERAGGVPVSEQDPYATAELA